MEAMRGDLPRCNRPEYTPDRIISGVKEAYARLYPGILWPRPIHTPQAILYTHDCSF